jgi:hypothetical protein
MRGRNDDGLHDGGSSNSRILLLPGRLTLVFLEAKNIRRKDQAATATQLRPYASVFMAAASAASSRSMPSLRSSSQDDSSADSRNNKSVVAAALLQKRTATQKEIRDTTFRFQHEELVLDIDDPFRYVATISTSSAMNHNNNDSGGISLTIQLRDNPAQLGAKDVLLAEAKVSLAPYMTAKTPAKEQWISVKHPSDESSNSAVSLRLSFQPVYCGMLLGSFRTSLQSRTGGSSYNNMCEPTCSLILMKNGEEQHPAATANKNEKLVFGQSDRDNDDELGLWLNPSNWFDKAVLEIRDRESEQLLAPRQDPQDMHTFMTNKKPFKYEVTTSCSDEDGDDDSTATGMPPLEFQWRFSPARQVLVHIDRGSNLMLDNIAASASVMPAPTEEDQHPPPPPSRSPSFYVVIKSKGRVHTIHEQTQAAHQNSDSRAVEWNSNLQIINVVDHVQMDVECYCSIRNGLGAVGGDASDSDTTLVLVGRGEISLTRPPSNRNDGSSISIESIVQLTTQDRVSA